MTMEPSSVESGVVHVWHARTDDLCRLDVEQRACALARLDASERARYDRYRRDLDRHMFLLGRVMARAVVADALQVPPDAWRWREGDRGRPEIDAAACAVSFNLAHSDGSVVCALSRTGPVGVDIENRTRTPLERALVVRCCHVDEAADVDARGDDWRDRFLQYWTLKESYLKAVGLGISVHLPDVRFRLGPPVQPAFVGSLSGADAGWTFDLTTIDPAHFVAVAVSPADGGRPHFSYQPFPDRWWPR